MPQTASSKMKDWPGVNTTYSMCPILTPHSVCSLHPGPVPHITCHAWGWGLCMLYLVFPSPSNLFLVFLKKQEWSFTLWSSWKLTVYMLCCTCICGKLVLQRSNLSQVRSIDLPCMELHCCLVSLGKSFRS